MTIECYHANCIYHAKALHDSTDPLCGRADGVCQFPTDILVWRTEDHDWCYPQDVSHAERLLGSFVRILTNAVEIDDLDEVAYEVSIENFPSFNGRLQWFNTIRPNYLP